MFGAEAEIWGRGFDARQISGRVWERGLRVRWVLVGAGKVAWAAASGAAGYEMCMLRHSKRERLDPVVFHYAKI